MFFWACVLTFMAAPSFTVSGSIRMREDAELYANNNNITRSAAEGFLEEYGSKLKWKASGERIFDIGPGDGSVTEILIKYLPDNYEMLIGYDISENMVRYANKHHGDERTKFEVLDIEADLPEELRESFDHGFSLCTFHWITNQKKAYTNLYDLLKPGGECMVTFFGHLPTYSLFIALSRTQKWGKWLTEVDKMVSPYHDYHDPEATIVNMLNEIGFQDIHVKCKQSIFVFDNTDSLRRLAASIDPFDIPKELYNDFLDDIVQVARDMRTVDEATGAVKFIYNLFIVHCRK